MNHLRSKTNFQNEFDAWIFYCKKTFNYENLKVEYYEDIDKFSCELQLKIKKMSEHEEAFLALAKDKCFAEDLIERFKDELQYQNICISEHLQYQNICTLRNFGCNAIWYTWDFYLEFYDGKGQPRTYACPEIDERHEHSVRSLYNFWFKSCDYCNGVHYGDIYDENEVCSYTKSNVEFLVNGNKQTTL